jgi:hypothetical protein
MLLETHAWLVSDKEYESLIQKHWEMVRGIHFDKNSGTPYWINKAQEYNINPNSLRTLQDFLDSPIGLCEESEINQKPISYFIPRSTNRYGLRIFTSSGSMGKKKEVPWTDIGLNYASDYASYMFDKTGISRDIDWIVQGPMGIWQETIYKTITKRNGIVHSAAIESRNIKRYFNEIRSPEDFAKNIPLQTMLGPASEFTADTMLKEKIKGIATAIQNLPPIVNLPGFDNVEALYFSGMEIPKDQYEFWRGRLPHIKFISSFGHHQLGFSYNPPSQFETYYTPSPLSLVYIVDKDNPKRLVEYGERGRHKILRMDDVYLWCQLDRDYSERVPPQGELKWDGIKDVQPLL